MLEEYIVAHPESFDCMVDVAELCFEFPSELLLLLLLAVSNIPAQICKECYLLVCDNLDY